jgi:hypothetical protein
MEIEKLDDAKTYSGDVARLFQLPLSYLERHENPI